MICQERTELNRIKNRFGIVIFHRCMILLTNKHSHNGLVTTDVSYYLFFIFLEHAVQSIIKASFLVDGQKLLGQHPALTLFPFEPSSSALRSRFKAVWLEVNGT